MTTPISPSSLRIAHCGDLHLGAGYAHGDEDKGGVNSRLVDFREAWVRSCRQMVEDDVGLVLLAGDVFESAKPTPTELAAFRAGLDILIDADIPTEMIPGNHDLPRQAGRTSALRIFDNYRGRVNLRERPTTLRSTSSCPVAIAYFPYPMRAHIAAADPVFEKLTLDEQNQNMVDLSLATIRGLAAEADQQAGPLGCILLGHAAITGSTIGAEQSTMFLREPVLPLAELRGLPFRYQAWGHLHRAQELEPGIRYSG
ncbi:MAG: metallophosphoesterase, partial [Thermoleophilia bacterium]|nr:metallophosphoesterase [Thermoleophilia bacterium]